VSEVEKERHKKKNPRKGSEIGKKLSWEKKTNLLLKTTKQAAKNAKRLPSSVWGNGPEEEGFLEECEQIPGGDRGNGKNSKGP